MHLFKGLIIIGFSALTLASGSVWAQSSSKYQFFPPVFGWPQKHWDGQDFKPYLDDPKHTYNEQWRESLWKPEDWASQRGGGANVINGFYQAGIINDQFVDDALPVLEVGPAFYMLSGRDKRRVAEMIDSVFQITTAKENGMFVLVDWATGREIGQYTSYGLQLQ